MIVSLSISWFGYYPLILRDLEEIGTEDPRTHSELFFSSVDVNLLLSPNENLIKNNNVIFAAWLVS